MERVFDLLFDLLYWLDYRRKCRLCVLEKRAKEYRLAAHLTDLRIGELIFEGERHSLDSGCDVEFGEPLRKTPGL